MLKSMKFLLILFQIITYNCYFVILQQCQSIDGECDFNKHQNSDKILLLYSVSPFEGFNLCRDVYLRVAVAVKRAPSVLTLVLPPWNRLPHWQYTSRPLRWDTFFQPEPMKEFIPVVELSDVLPKNGPLVIDRLYRLTHFENAFEGGSFIEKWEFKNMTACRMPVNFWGYDVEVKNEICLAFQGSASKIFELLALNPDDDVVMFSNAEILLHDEYGTEEYWKARKSVQFHERLITAAENFIRDHLDCDTKKCSNYFSAHWRRGDFAKGRAEQVPSVVGAANQLVKISKRPEISLKLLFIATDATSKEYRSLKEILEKEGITVIRYVPKIPDEFVEGAIAIIDQIICSRAAYFVGTHESTFTFRIQEEREILDFDSDTTFNRLCPDFGSCERPSRWKIVH